MTNHAARIKRYLDERPFLPPSLRAALEYALDCIRNPLIYHWQNEENILAESLEVLRSAYMIAERQGRETNWSAFGKSALDAAALISVHLRKKSKKAPLNLKAVGEADAVMDEKTTELNKRLGTACEQLSDANMKIIKLTNLLGEIIQQATNEPAKLTAFNSPLLQLACIELYEHNHPDEEPDDRSKQIFRQMALAGYNG